MADLLLYRFVGVVLLSLLGLLLIQAASAVALWRIFRHVDAHGRVIRRRAMETLEILVDVDQGVGELVKAERKRRIESHENLRFWRAVYSKPLGVTGDPAEAGGVEEGEGVDDGETGEEAGPAEVEDPEGQRGA